MFRKIGKMRWIGGAVAAGWLLLIAFQAVGSGPEKNQSRFRSDLIVITTALPADQDEVAPVVFLHDKHTAALEENSCASCHPKGDKGTVFRFKQTEPVPPGDAKDLYHENCISCHKETKAAGKDSGPLAADCRACHREAPGYESNWSDIPFDKSLHYRHVSSQGIRPREGETVREDGANCSACHHAFDLKTEKLGYPMGEEGSCAYCHKSEAIRDDMIRRTVPAIRRASHTSCVGCHESRAQKKNKRGPTTCGGCHDATQRAKIEVMEKVPRIPRNQPDNVLLATSLKKAATSGMEVRAAVDAVAFGHVSHEQGVASCKVCHHASLESCAACHTPSGDEKGGNIRLGQAMHMQGDNASCVACHNQSKKASECAGCHSQIPVRSFEDSNCRLCHNIEPAAILEGIGDKEWTSARAAEEVAARTRPMPMVDKKDIPETVTIDSMVNQFDGVKLPHGKIVQSLYNGIADNRLARYFHREATTLCQGCHHYSPASLKPPRCASCHGAPFADEAGGRPGLQGAYHMQCIGCHEKMGIEKPAANDCSACHPKRRQTAFQSTNPQ